MIILVLAALMLGPVRKADVFDVPRTFVEAVSVDDWGWTHVRVSDAYDASQRSVVPTGADDPNAFGYFVYFDPDGRRQPYPRKRRSAAEAPPAYTEPPSLLADTFIYGIAFGDDLIWHVADRRGGRTIPFDCQATRLYYAVVLEDAGPASGSIICESRGQTGTHRGDAPTGNETYTVLAPQAAADGTIRRLAPVSPAWTDRPGPPPRHLTHRQLGPPDLAAAPPMEQRLKVGWLMDSVRTTQAMLIELNVGVVGAAEFEQGQRAALDGFALRPDLHCRGIPPDSEAAGQGLDQECSLHVPERSAPACAAVGVFAMGVLHHLDLVVGEGDRSKLLTLWCGEAPAEFVRVRYWVQGAPGEPRVHLDVRHGYETKTFTTGHAYATTMEDKRVWLDQDPVLCRLAAYRHALSYQASVDRLAEGFRKTTPEYQKEHALSATDFAYLLDQLGYLLMGARDNVVPGFDGNQTLRDAFLRFVRGLDAYVLEMRTAAKDVESADGGRRAVALDRMRAADAVVPALDEAMGEAFLAYQKTYGLQ